MTEMKRSTAIRHLVGLAEESSRLAALPNFDWPVDEMWVAGEVMDGLSTFDGVTVILLLDVPAEKLTWLALHPIEAGVVESLRLSKLPVWHRMRPVGGPAWNAVERRVVRFWHASEGLDWQLIEALRLGERVEAVEVSADEYVQQMETELVGSRAHLKSVLNDYWKPDWRREHRGWGVYPEDHLWRAAEAVHDIEAALNRAID